VNRKKERILETIKMTSICCSVACIIIPSTSIFMRIPQENVLKVILREINRREQRGYFKQSKCPSCAA
jgi:hypothetical protein